MLKKVYTIGDLIQPLAIGDRSLFINERSLNKFRNAMDPGDHTYAVLLGQAADDIEAVKVTMTDSGMLLLTRAQGGTTELNFPTGSCINSMEGRLYADDLICSLIKTLTDNGTLP